MNDKIKYYQSMLYQALNTIESLDPKYFDKNPEIEEYTIDAIDSGNTLKMNVRLSMLAETIDKLRGME